MSGKYEKQWKDAMSGASVEPSENLWGNIAANMDAERGRNNWLTILLIAATVTVAFAFPLTVGNSSFEARPDEYNELVQSSIDDNTTVDNASIEDQNTIDKSITDETEFVANQSDKENLLAQNNTEISDTDQDIRIITSNDKKLTERTAELNTNSIAVTGSDDISVLAADPYGLSLDDSGVLYALEPDALENHYLLPFYLSPPHEMERELLASLNMGRGSASSAGGSSGIGNLFASDRYEALADFGSNKISTDDRYENKGITSYLGAGIEVPFGEKLALLAGVGYLAQKATGMSNIVVDDGGEYKPVSAYDPIEPGAVFLSDSYEYSVLNSFLNIPITVKYPFINKKVKLRGGIGLSTDIMVGHKVSSSEYSSASYQPKAMEYKPVVFSGLANLDVRYDLSESYGVAFEMGYRKGLTSIDESQQYYPSSFTAGLVLFYKIR